MHDKDAYTYIHTHICGYIIVYKLIFLEDYIYVDLIESKLDSLFARCFQRINFNLLKC